MAGHSKWKNIMHRKGAQDAKKSKQFQKLSKEIYIAAKSESNPELNPALRLAVDKAKSINMPKDNIQRAIDKASGTDNDINYEELTYEGYGPKGVAFLIKTLTDNKNRTAASVRSLLSKSGGNLGENGSVSYMFDRKAKFVFENKQDNNDDLLLELLDIGVNNVENQDNLFEIIETPELFETIKDFLIQKENIEILEMDIKLISNSLIEIDEETEEKINTLIDKLNDDDDVQDVYHNADI